MFHVRVFLSGSMVRAEEALVGDTLSIFWIGPLYKGGGNNSVDQISNLAAEKITCGRREGGLHSSQNYS